MAAFAIGVVQIMIDGIGFGWTFTLFGGTATISAFLYFVEMKKGMKWRLAKRGNGSKSEELPQRRSIEVTEPTSANEKC